MIRNPYEAGKKSIRTDGFAALSERGWQIFEKEDVLEIVQLDGPGQTWELNIATASLEKGKCGSVEWTYQMMLERIWTPDFLKGRVPRYQCPKASILNDGSAQLAFYGVFPPNNIPLQKIITFSPLGKVSFPWSSLPNIFFENFRILFLHSLSRRFPSSSPIFDASFWDWRCLLGEYKRELGISGYPRKRHVYRQFDSSAKQSGTDRIRLLRSSKVRLSMAFGEF